MKPALFSQSLFALPLEEAIRTTAAVGFEAIELACAAPHFDLALAKEQPERVAELIRDAGLEVAALSLFNHLTDADAFDEQVSAAATFVRLAPLFGTKLVKATPGPPASAEATEEVWGRLAEALDRLVPVAREAGVRLAFETHMRQLTDTVGGSKRLLAMAPADVAGLTVDFSNLAFAGEPLPECLGELLPRTWHAHVKNGCIDPNGGWHFGPLDQGLTDYRKVLPVLRDAGYEGYLSIECLGQGALTQPAETARRDLQILEAYLKEV